MYTTERITTTIRIMYTTERITTTTTTTTAPSIIIMIGNECESGAEVGDEAKGR